MNFTYHPAVRIKERLEFTPEKLPEELRERFMQFMEAQMSNLVSHLSINQLKLMLRYLELDQKALTRSAIEVKFIQIFDELTAQGSFNRSTFNQKFNILVKKYIRDRISSSENISKRLAVDEHVKKGKPFKPSDVRAFGYENKGYIHRKIGHT